jgi:lipopolysaccharide exporter
MKPLLQSILFRQVMTLFTGASLGQLVALACSPLIARLYEPREFGIFALLSSLTGVLTVISGGRYDIAMMLPKEDEDACQLLYLSLGLNLVAFFLILGLSALSHLLLADWLIKNHLYGWLYTAPLLVLGGGLTQVTSLWLNRKKEYVILARTRLFLTFLTLSLNLCFGFLHWGFAGLLYSSLITQLLFSTYLLWQLHHQGVFSIPVSWLRVKKLAYTYRDFPRINGMQSLIDTAQASFFIVMISQFFGATTLGWYSYARKMLAAPLAPISASITDVLYQKASEIYAHDGDLKSFVRKIIRLGLASVLPAMLFAWLLAPPLFSWVFGERWLEAGQYARLISPWIFVNFLSTLVGYLPMIVKEQKMDLILATFGNVVNLLLVLIGGFYWRSMTLTLIALSTFQFIFHFSCLFWSIQIAGKKRVEYENA